MTAYGYNGGKIMTKSTSDYIFLEKDGIIKEVEKPEYGDVVIKFKDGQPYDIQVITKIKL